MAHERRFPRPQYPTEVPTASSPPRQDSQITHLSVGSLPEFLTPSSESLSALLYTLNTSILLPKHLNREQRALVYQKENAARLEAESIDITLGNVTVPLVHIDRARNQPSQRRSVREIVKGSSTADDHYILGSSYEEAST